MAISKVEQSKELGVTHFTSEYGGVLSVKEIYENLDEALQDPFILESAPAPDDCIEDEKNAADDWEVVYEK